jgi:hypothetical protein
MVQCIGQAKNSNLRRMQSQGRSRPAYGKGKTCGATRAAMECCYAGRCRVASAGWSGALGLGGKPLSSSTNWSAS